MGVGTPDDILKSVARGIDMFDCVMPTRAGRHGLAYTRRGKVNLRNARHADDPRPLDEESDCPAARDYSRAYLHHLVVRESLGAMLLTWNNVAYYQQLMQDIRDAIEQGRFADRAAEITEGWARGDLAACEASMSCRRRQFLIEARPPASDMTCTSTRTEYVYPDGIYVAMTSSTVFTSNRSQAVRLPRPSPFRRMCIKSTS